MWYAVGFVNQTTLIVVNLILFLILGWHRQCQVTPYTSDTDFASWAKYLNGHYLTDRLRTEAPKHGLKVITRFGEPNHNLEYTLKTKSGSELVDIFFIYTNQTHYHLSSHKPPNYIYSVFPQYELCSIEFLGHKLLAPCDPEMVVKSGRKHFYSIDLILKTLLPLEYGANWWKPINSWDYFNSPNNLSPIYQFPSNISQKEDFYF